MTARAPELLKRMASTVRFSGVVLEDYSNHTDIAQDGRFAAMTFSAGKDSIYIAYRGTDNNKMCIRDRLPLRRDMLGASETAERSGNAEKLPGEF